MGGISIRHQFGEVLKIKTFFEKIRKPRKNVPLNRQVSITLGVILFGFGLGIFQKWIDGTASSTFPNILQQLDIGNYFGRLAIWILLATIISVYSESPLRAAINTFFFFISMLAGYYLYCNFILGGLLFIGGAIMYSIGTLGFADMDVQANYVLLPQYIGIATMIVGLCLDFSA